MNSKYSNMISCKDYVSSEKKRIKDFIESSNKQYKLNIFQIGNNPASNSYIKGKLKDCKEVGIEAQLLKYDENIDQERLYRSIYEASRSIMDNDISGGVILQLPVPKHINAKLAIKYNVPAVLDVDGFCYSRHDPCTPRGIIDWLMANEIQLDGKNVVIIGRSDIVGKPLAKMMEERNATVTLCHSHTNAASLEAFCQLADIIIVAVGKAKFFSMNLPQHPIIVDVGINRDENGKLCGDVDYETMTNQGCYVTPVPGGVGLLTRLALLKNIIDEN